MISAISGMDSWHSRLMAEACSSDPPQSSRGSKTPLSAWPKRVTVIEPVPPIGDVWQFPQNGLLKIGPSPLATVSGSLNFNLPTLNRFNCSGVNPGSGSPIFRCGTTVPAKVAEPRTQTVIKATAPRPNFPFKTDLCQTIIEP